MPERARVRVVARGELDLASTERLVREVDALLGAGFADVVVDLGELTFMDSSGIRALLKCDRRAGECGGRLSVVLVPGPVARTIELCGVRGLLHLVESA